MNQRESLIQHIIEGKKLAILTEESGIARSQFAKWYETGGKTLETIRRANQLFANRKNKEDFFIFEKLGRRHFFEWYDSQPKTCYYCGIDEEKLQKLFDYDTGILNTKRGRGRNLELERRDAENNAYTPENCVLACYLCNNHKSDLISESEHNKYFAKQIRAFQEDKYQEMNAGC